MIDLHCHILPGIDDGAKTLDDALAMARIAVDDGIHTLACTPHIYPGMYMNDGPGIAQARDRLQAELDRHGIALQLVVGADVHLVPGLVAGLQSGRVPTLNGSRYFLLEPSHTTPPPRLEASVFHLIAAGYTPIITHPERLTWVEDHYPVFLRLIAQGAWMQVTAAALTGVFGKRARYWGERFIGDGHTHLLATDAHSTGRRLPRLTEGLEVARRLVGEGEASRLVVERPTAVLHNLPPQGFELTHKEVGRPSMISRWLSKRRSPP
ncbi:CpsB/CapC family capsule biosynthesis tyrosine phosphatase [Hydrogenophaga sp. 2FB]|uniref:tyrosine-protein phosphatase n=1 Tax=Hydrogenophaga sp. 2FB TaxID=2502187 RepID=UPI0010F76CBD|nr:CpsB/CapC family capsule biosynthesis tyrosine phosphatase [Hydrogenophaga sp. 2FB]